MRRDYVEFENTDAEFKMILVEGGVFDMGGESIEYDSLPIHKVEVSSFWMAEFAVTQAIWGYIMLGTNKANPSSFKGLNRPVENVSYEDIVKEFLPRLNSMMGRSANNLYRLPTEAEWEYAAKGGRYGNKYPFEYAGSNKLEEVGWYYENSHEETRIVGLKMPNLLGLHDMSGNVWEWCIDWYKYDYYKEAVKRAISNPIGPAIGSGRVYRGGSWDDSAEYCLSANRLNYSPTFRGNDVGFRLVLSFSSI